MAFEDLDAFFDSTLKLPIGGKSYVIPSPDAELGLRCQVIADISRKASIGMPVTDAERAMMTVSDDQEESWFARTMGPAYEEMLTDGVDWVKIRHAAGTVFIWITQGQSSAERYWGSNRPEGRAPKAPRDRKPSAKKKKSGRRGSPAGSTSPSPASPGDDSSSTGT